MILKVTIILLVTESLTRREILMVITDEKLSV